MLDCAENAELTRLDKPGSLSEENETGTDAEILPKSVLCGSGSSVIVACAPVLVKVCRALEISDIALDNATLLLKDI